MICAQHAGQQGICQSPGRRRCYQLPDTYRRTPGGRPAARRPTRPTRAERPQAALIQETLPALPGSGDVDGSQEARDSECHRARASSNAIVTRRNRGHRRHGCLARGEIVFVMPGGYGAVLAERALDGVAPGRAHRYPARAYPGPRFATRSWSTSRGTAAPGLPRPYRIRKRPL